MFATNETAPFQSDELSANGCSHECAVGNLDEVDVVLTALPVDEERQNDRLCFCDVHRKCKRV